MKEHFDTDWIVKGAHWGYTSPKRPLEGAVLRKLIELDKDDLENAYLEADTYHIGEFTTDKPGAVNRIMEAAVELTKGTDIRLDFFYHYDYAWLSDGFIVEEGQVRGLTGKACYTHDYGGYPYRAWWD